jgi:acetyltransferase-like isoleucine patch superfamily enzyme
LGKNSKGNVGSVNVISNKVRNLRNCTGISPHKIRRDHKELIMKDRTGKELTSQEVMKKGAARVGNILLEFEVFLLNIVGYIPLHHVRRFFYRVAGIKIGKGSTIHMKTVFYDPRNISIGNDSIIGERAVLDGREKLIIGNHVDIASEVMIYNSHHDIRDEHFTAIQKPVVIEDYVFVGPRAIILPGVTIGKGAVVGAGAVVTKDVAPLDIVGGVPANKIGKRSEEDLHYKLGRARWFR